MINVRDAIAEIKINLIFVVDFCELLFTVFGAIILSFEFKIEVVDVKVEDVKGEDVQVGVEEVDVEGVDVEEDVEGVDVE